MEEKKDTSSTSPSRREFIQQGLGTAALIGASAICGSGCGEETSLPVTRDVFPGGDHVLTPDGPIASDLGVDSASLDLPAADAALPVVPITTARQRIVPVLPPKKQSTFDKAQWGITKVASGEAHVRHDALGVDVLRPGGGTPSSVLLVPHLSDTHLVDEESPARTIELDGFVGKIAGGWRYQDAHMTYVLDAMIRKIREIDAFRPVDFVMHTGDAIDNCQYNELMWFQTVMAGGKVVPNSGALEDPIPGPDNDPHDGFTAMGLGTIPYYVAYGNHDGLVQGNLPLDSGPGDHSSIAGDPTRNNVTQLQLTKTDPPACHPIPTDESPAPPRCVPTYRQDLKAGSLVADKKRQDLNRFEYFDLWLKARGEPKGHGFDVMNATTQRGNYVVTPIPGVPLRLVGLDTCAPLGAQGDYPQKDIDDFLVPALKQAEVDGVAVIVASHHPTAGVFGTGKAIVKALNASPNVLLHLVGHGHKNEVIPHQGASVAYGYWEVQTCSLADWPQQARLVELVDNRDGSGEFWMTLMDYDTHHGHPGDRALESRFFSVYELQKGECESHIGEATDRNVILPILFPSAVGSKLSVLPHKTVTSKLLEG